MVDVADGQPESLDLRQLRVGGYIGYVPAKLAEGLVDELSSTPLLLIGLDALDDLLRWRRGGYQTVLQC